MLNTFKRGANTLRILNKYFLPVGLVEFIGNTAGTKFSTMLVVPVLASVGASILAADTTYTLKACDFSAQQGIYPGDDLFGLTVQKTKKICLIKPGYFN